MKSRKLRERLSELEHEVAAQQQRGLELKSEIDRHESRIHFNEERLREIESQNSKALTEITQAEERCRAAKEELATVSEKLAASEAALAQHKENLPAKQQALQEVEDGLRQRQESLRQAQSTAFAAAQDLTRIRNEITALDLQKQGNIIRLEKLSAEKMQLEEERTRLEARLQEFTASVEVEKLNVATTRGSVEQRQNRLRELQTELQQSSVEQDQFLQQQAEKRSRLHVLEQLEGSHEGFDAGAVAALAPVALGHRLAGGSHPRARPICRRGGKRARPSPATRAHRAAVIRAGNSRRPEREQDRPREAWPRFPLPFLTTSSLCSAEKCRLKRINWPRKMV